MQRTVAAPELLEVSTIWWDVERVPVVTWDKSGCSFDLVDPQEPDMNRLRLLRLERGATDPDLVARTLAQGLAACDFPPTDKAASPNRVAATLRAARVDPHA
ncbi:MAG: hypothetical protein ACI867_000148 [Glaciecola sp.]|jgi:hypothetical protein